MSRKGSRAGVTGTVTQIGWTIRKTGRSSELIALVEVNLGNQKGKGAAMEKAVEKRLKALRKKIHKKKVQLYTL